MVPLTAPDALCAPTDVVSLRSVDLNASASCVKERRQRLSFSSRSEATASTAPGTSTSEATMSSRTRELREHESALQKAAADYAEYTAILANHFPPPPAVLPPHLCNDFSSNNVITARNHLGRVDRPELSSMTDGAPLALQETEKEAVNNNGNAMDTYDLFTQRFKITSRANGDIIELDAKRGRRYWEKEKPAVFPRHLPSQLLREREEEECHKFRLYSQRWGEMLKDLADALGGEEGEDLMHHYETREESQPLSPKCSRAFYQTVVDYDAMLDEQDEMFRKVEEDYERYVDQLIHELPDGKK